MRGQSSWVLGLCMLVLGTGCPSTHPTHQGLPTGAADGGSSQVAGSGGHAGGTVDAGVGGGKSGTGGGGASGAAGGSTGSGKHDAGAILPGSDGGGINDAGGSGGCVRGGCSNELCTEASADPVASTCIYTEAYACYQKAPCARQTTGKCGFTPSQTLSDCLVAAQGGGALSWYETCGAPVCRATPVDDPNVPNCTTEKAGAACSTQSATCDLVNPCGTKLSCTNQDPTKLGCPRSRARYKRDIAYLDDARRERIYRDLLSIPLASYDYKDDPNAAPQLGFIMEDIEPSPAVRGDRVNLYGYLSMTVAALQVQAKEIEALRAEVRSLRERAPTSAAVSCEP